jgi:isopenicillin-N epimerase
MERNPVRFLGRESAQLLGQARAHLAKFLGAQAEDLIFISNATTGVNIVARSLVLQPGDEILATSHEYGACDVTWERVCAAHGARYRHIDIPLPLDAQSFADRLCDSITPRTRLIFMSHLTSTTALKFPVEEVCERARSMGIKTLIDGAHAPGQIPLQLDRLSADFYTGNCHKWMCAPKGSAFLHARAEHHADLHATVTSWGYAAETAGHAGFDAYTGSTLLERRLQWQGTRDPSAWLSVPAAIDFVQSPSWRTACADARERALALMHQWCAHIGLPPIGQDRDFAQMVPLPVRHRDSADAARLRQQLFDDWGIEVPVTQQGDHTFVRVSVQPYNSAQDLERLFNALVALTESA